MTTEAKTVWTHKVVKKQRGADGNWFKYPAAMTGTLDEADKYAKKFAEDQTGVGGTKILVVARKGNVVIRSYTC